MNAAHWPAVRLRLLPLWHRWRWPGVIGVVCLAAAAWVHTMVLPDLREQQARAGDELLQAERQAERRRQAGSSAVPLAPSQRFRDAFPPAGERHDRLAALVSLAAIHGIPAPRIDLRWLPGEPLARYEITMSAVVAYADLRAFLSAALASDPALSLDALQLRRVDAAAPQVEAEVRWSLYLRDRASAAAAAVAPVRAEPTPVRAEPVEASGVLTAALRQAQCERLERARCAVAPVRAEPTSIWAEPTPVGAEPTPVRAEPVEAGGVLTAALRQAQCERLERARCAGGLVLASTDKAARLP